MFTIIMLILKFLWSRLYSWIYCLSTICHLSDFLKNYCIVDCFVCIFSPCKWSVIFAKYGRNGNRIKISCVKLAYDKLSCVFFICILNLLFCKAAYTWNLTVNIICMCCSVTWNSSSPMSLNAL